MANDINVVTLSGNLTRDAELKHTNGGMAICEFSLAVNGSKKQGDEWVNEAHFFDCTMFGRQAEAVAKYLTKGKSVVISGRLKQDRWQNKEGQNRSKVGIAVNDLKLTSGSKDDGASAPQRQASGNDEYSDDIPF